MHQLWIRFLARERKAGDDLQSSTDLSGNVIDGAYEDTLLMEA